MEFLFRVKLNYNYFLFEDGNEALTFAMQACAHQTDYADEAYDCSIDFVPIKETEDPEDNGEASAGAAMLRGDC